MKSILWQAMKNCANKYAKGFPRWEHLWQEKTAIEIQAQEMSDELQAMGYRLLKIKSDEPAKVFEYPFTEKDCYEQG
jgi:hypothetical protein